LVTISSGINELEKLTSLDNSQKGLVTICKIATQRGLTLINSILDLSRIESGEMPLDIENTDLDEVIISSLEMVSIFAKKYNVVLEKKIESLPKNFYTDHSLLSRILVNLLSNAIKASAEGDTVSVHATAVDNSIIFSVIDQGAGFPAYSISKVYRKFTQFHKKGRGDMAGSGLGLAFCKLAVEALGGKIEMETQESNGTKVTFMLPNKIDRNS
jgi:signal transduction histidine kinase